METSSKDLCGNSTIVVQAFADGELKGRQWFVFKDHLGACPDCAAEYSRMMVLKALFKPDSLRYRAPDPLRLRVKLAVRAASKAAAVRKSGASSSDYGTFFRRDLIRKEWKQRQGTMFALAASLAIALTFSLTGPALEDEIIAKYQRSLEVNLAADSQSPAFREKQQFAGNLGFVPPAPDLASSGFAYRGARFDQVAQRDAAVFIYTQQGHVIDLFLWPSEEEPLGAISRNGYRIIHWTQAGLKLCAISNMDAEDLSRFKEAVAAKLPA